ncbi:MAG: U32 family peptidase [Candidatus Falkowbacteria bacterium]
MTISKTNKIKLELLAPARDFESGRLAILAGADAVYIGGPNFGARSAASNSWENIAALITLAHKYYVKVYLAINTIFFNEEAVEVKEAIWRAYELGIDALIIQDMGILEMELPPLPIHASTQTNNYDLEQIKFLEKAGFSRVILARELSLSEITKIKKETKIDLEFFVHGALCVSMSGNCYFSQALSGRSANRGRCQQVCRLPFSLVDADGKELMTEKYLLSPKDLNLINSLGDLSEAGITSFKIEGRLKDSVYVTNVVAKYRAELDKIIEASAGKFTRASSGLSVINFIPDLAKTFNRGYTDYFLHGRQPEIVAPDNQKSLGKYIGKVKRVDHRYFTLDAPFKLSNGDGLCWFNSRGQLNGTNVNLISEGKIYPNKWIPLKPGTLIYCNQDQAFEKAVASGASRSLAVDIEIGETEKGWLLSAIDEDKNKVELLIETAKVLAEKKEQALANWQKQFSKAGETIFRVESLKFNWANPGFVPMSLLNDWRRQLLDLLMAKRLEKYPREIINLKKTTHAYPEKNLDYSYNIANDLAKDFYQRHKSVILEEALELQTDNRGRKLMTTKHCLRYFLQACPRRLKADSPLLKEPLFLVYNGKKYPLKFNCDKCVMEIYNS